MFFLFFSQAPGTYMSFADEHSHKYKHCKQVLLNSVGSH